MNSQRIYLDNAATTTVRAEVLDAMREVAADAEYNPSSLHAEGRRARAVLEDARRRVAAALGAFANEIVFTAGGTEADNLAIAGIAALAPSGAHLVACAIEHHGVLAPLERLRERGFEVTLLPVGRSGHVDPDAFEAALRPQTVLASVMYANNEIGTVQPVARLAAIARERGVRFHTDAVQAPAWLPVDVGRLGVDLLSLSAHKLGGPKGVGLLYVRRGVELAPVLDGGGQESGRRSGTQNVPGIVGFARAIELAVAERQQRAPVAAALRDRLEEAVRAAGGRINGGEPRLPNVCNASFWGIDAPQMLIALDLAGVAVSAGSACTSGSLEPSHVLAALGGGPDAPAAGIRFSLGTQTSELEVERVAATLPEVAGRLRGGSRETRGDWVDTDRTARRWREKLEQF